MHVHNKFKFVCSYHVHTVQLLHKLSIHADDGPMKLMKVMREKFGWLSCLNGVSVYCISM